jgi:hypothetical protein
MDYEDDRFHPTAIDDDDDFEEFHYYEPSEAYHQSDSSTIDTYRKKQRKNAEDFKNIDKGYHRIKRIINHIPIHIEVYTTVNVPGILIRDAITGARYSQYRVGSSNEYLFFKAMDVTGDFGKEGGLMFFDSPEQYEKHMKTIVSSEIKEKWLVNRDLVLSNQKQVVSENVVVK